MSSREIGLVVWFTGLHGAGKTTIANGLAANLRKKGVPLILLDGDSLRKSISSDLGYTLKERNKHMKRVADLCKIISDNFVISIACVASPTQESRDYARSKLRNMFLVYVKCPLEVCEKRDVKGHYRKARSGGKFRDFVGVDLGFEEPKNPDIVLNTDKESVEESVNRLLEEITGRKLIK